MASFVASPRPRHSLRSAPGQLQCLFYREAIALCHRCKPLLHLFMHYMFFHKLFPLLLKGMMQIHEGIVFMDLSAVVHVLVLTRKGVTECEAQSYKCGDTCGCL